MLQQYTWSLTFLLILLHRTHQGVESRLPPTTPNEPPKCTNTTHHFTGPCHGWSTFGTTTKVGSPIFECNTTVPSIPRAFQSIDTRNGPTHYLYCNVVADGATGRLRQQLFGQLVPQIMIGEVEVCGGKNNSAFGPHTHLNTSTWLAQAQYYFVDAATSAPKCVGGDILPVIAGQHVHMSIVFNEEGAVVTISIQGGRTSVITVSSPQLQPALTWKSYLDAGDLRPYVSFESWNAPSKDRAAYPTGDWTVVASALSQSTWGVWNSSSTAMSVTQLENTSAVWTYK